MGMCLSTKKYESHSKRPSLGKGGRTGSVDQKSDEK